MTRKPADRSSWAIGRRAFLARASAGLALAAAPGVVRAQNLRKLTVLVSTTPADPAFHVFYFAQNKGFYRDGGLDIEVKPMNGDTTAVRVLLSGGADIASVGALPSIQAAVAGGQAAAGRMKIISCFNPKLDYLLVAAAGIDKARQLEGKAVAVSQVGATSHMIAQLLIERGGGDISKVNWLSVGASSARVQALIAKRVDAAPLNSSFAQRAKALGQVTVVGDAIQDLQNFVYAWEIVSPQMLEKNRDALQAFVTATARAARWAVGNAREAAAISQGVVPDLPPQEVAAAIEHFARQQFWGTSGEVSPRTWDYTMSSMLKLKAIELAPGYQDLVVPEFAAATARQLGDFKAG